jgi:geranylgeranyl diphosphate synthase, type II
MNGFVAGFPLADFLSTERERVEDALQEAAAPFVDPIVEVLREPVRYALATRGKRIRPILCVAAHRAVRVFDADRERPLYRLASALEIVHTYSLVHDDLPCMDDDDLRRGRPTVHRVHGATRATLAGGALVPLAVQVLLGAAEELGLDLRERSVLARELCRATGGLGMVGGQLLDLEGESVPVDAAGLEAIHRAKTGALLSGSLRIGAISARADAATLQALTRYGDALGLAFQITDDVLDVTAESAVLGKTAGKDASHGKSTYPALFGVEGAMEMARERAGEAVEALRAGGIRAPALEALASYVVERGA